MRNIKNNKGLSQIITTLLIILIAIIAITLLWVVVKKITNPEILESPKQCLDYQSYPPYEITSSCYNQETKETEIKIKKSLTSEKINSLKFVISSKTDSSSYICGKNCNNCELTTASKKYYFSSDIKTTEIKLVVGDCVFESEEIKVC